MGNKIRYTVVLVIMLLGHGTAYASCGSAVCSFNTNWNELGQVRPGWTFDLRYSYSKADVLRSGTSKIVANPTDPANAGAEVENLRTVNQLATATLDYNHDMHWGLTVQVPYVMRNHTHSIGDPNPALVGFESFDAKSIGDIKVIGRYRWDLDASQGSGLGVRLGFKLNTGRKNFVIQQTGALPAEVTLQPGNGSTDVILGAFWNRSVPGSEWHWFAQAAFEASIKHHASFTPGNQTHLDIGTRYDLGHGLYGMLQFGAQWLGKDKGPAAALTAAGAASSGGHFFTVAPGLNYAVTPSAEVYTLVQIPIYQYVNGEQLTTKYSLVAGMRYMF